MTASGGIVCNIAQMLWLADSGSQGEQLPAANNDQHQPGLSPTSHVNHLSTVINVYRIYMSDIVGEV